MSAIGEFIVEFVVEPLLGLAPDARTDRGDAICCNLSGALSAMAMLIVLYFSGAHSGSTPGWATNAGPFFFLLAVAGLLYAAAGVFKRPRSRVAFGVAAVVNALAIALPFSLGHFR